MDNGSVTIATILTIAVTQIIFAGISVVLVAWLYNKFNSSNKKFNWDAAFFAPWRYAQHGRWGLALLFGLFYGGLWILAIGIIMIYTGIRAENDLRGLEPKYTYLSVILTIFMLFVLFGQLKNI